MNVRTPPDEAPRDHTAARYLGNTQVIPVGTLESL